MGKLIIFVFFALTMAGCAGTRHLTQTVERTVHDTLVQNTLQYDSVYVDNRLYTYREADTVYRERTCYEYKYKLLRDTVRIHKVDSIPVLRDVETVRQVAYTPWHYKLLAAVAFLLLAIELYRLLKKWNALKQILHYIKNPTQ